MDDYGMVGNKGDEEASLPKATVAKIIKEILPTRIRCANEARELVVEAGMEFLQMVSSQANDICTKEGRHKMNEVHVVAALRELKFDHYINEVNVVTEEHKVEAEGRKKKSSKRKLKDSGLSEEELKRQQEALFAKSRHFLESLTPTSTPRAAAPPSAGAAQDSSNASLVPEQAQNPSLVKDEFTDKASKDEAAMPAPTTLEGLAPTQLPGMEDEDDDYDDI